jgi:tetratricopeptide (TPR) repeat protein
MNSALECKLADADSYNDLAEEYYKIRDYHKALEYYDKSYISYLEILGDEHLKSIQTSEKIRDVIGKLSNHHAD